MLCFPIWAGKMDGGNIEEYFDSVTSYHTSAPAEMISKIAPDKDIWSVVAVRLESLPDGIQHRSPDPKWNLKTGGGVFPFDSCPLARMVLLAPGSQDLKKLLV